MHDSDTRKKVYLDGVLVYPEEINPKSHRFLGLFRPPVNPFINPTCNILCDCGQVLQIRGEEIEHYNRGCYDTPQYVSINNG